jgi:D-alanine-D-alanine ligase
MVHRDGTWSFPTDFTEESKKAAIHLNFADAIARITKMAPSAVVPHMFCLPGMTTFRALFDAIGVPMVGNTAGVMELSTNKHQSKAIVSAAGVPVPESELLHKGDQPKMNRPFILKPCNEDNSQGITLVREGTDLQEALNHAFTFDSEILCEKYVPLGREIRCAVLEQADGSLELLPCLEYFLTEKNPIRGASDKLVTDERGIPVTVTTGGRKCPADIDDALRSKLEQLCVRSHKALGCRDYSLYDVRVDPEGNPFFLEACLYCSFAPKSVIVGMCGAKNQSQQDVYEMLVSRAMERKKKSLAGSQLLGMKSNC